MASGGTFYYHEGLLKGDVMSASCESSASSSSLSKCAKAANFTGLKLLWG